jgi:hypothetical protein
MECRIESGIGLLGSPLPGISLHTPEFWKTAPVRGKSKCENAGGTLWTRAVAGDVPLRNLPRTPDLLIINYL